MQWIVLRQSGRRNQSVIELVAVITNKIRAIMQANPVKWFWRLTREGTKRRQQVKSDMINAWIKKVAEGTVAVSREGNNPVMVTII